MKLDRKVILMLFIAFFITSTIIMTHNVHAATWNVPTNFATIGAAIAGAAPGDTITVSAGTYHEAITINKQLTIIGAGAATTIIDGTGTPAGQPVVTIDSTADVSFSGFTVQKPTTSGSGTRFWIYAKQTTPTSGVTYTVSGCTIIGSNNPAGSGDFGFYGSGGLESIVFTHNTITEMAGNCMTFELHQGATEVSYCNLEAGMGATSADAIYFMTYGGKNVAALQNVEYNTFNMGVGLFDGSVHSTGVSFNAPGAGAGDASFTNIAITGNTFNNVNSYRRGIGFSTFNGVASSIVSPIVTKNLITGVLGSTASMGINFYDSGGLTIGATITCNTINGMADAIFLRVGDAPNTIINNNNIAGNTIGIDWTPGVVVPVNAINNWWGNPTGPNPPGSGDPITPAAKLTIAPWLTTPSTCAPNLSIGGQWAPITMQSLSPINTLGLLAPWIALALIAAATALATYRRLCKKHSIPTSA